MILVGLLNVIAGLGIAGWEDRWPDAWWRWRVFAGADPGVPVAHLVLPLACLLIASLACRQQMWSFLFVGLAGFSVSVQMLGHLYFSEVQAWPRVLILLGLLSLAVALYFELHRTRGNTLDDVVSRSRL